MALTEREEVLVRGTEQHFNLLRDRITELEETVNLLVERVSTLELAVNDKHGYVTRRANRLEEKVSGLELDFSIEKDRRQVGEEVVIGRLNRLEKRLEVVEAQQCQ